MNAQNLEFSIVIPAYNRPERLEQCLTSLAQLTYPYDRFEVIVVDDGSPVPLQTVAETFAGTLPLHVLRQDNAGPASARNAGAAIARGDYLVFTDDDCQPHPDWLDALARAANEFPNALIGGHTENAIANNAYSNASQLLVDYLYDYYNQARGKATFFTSNNFAMPRVLFQKLGGFDTSFPLAAGEDREFCDRWQHFGFALQYSPSMRIRHAHTLTLASFWRQHFNYGRGAYHFHRARSRRCSEPLKVEPLAFYLHLLLYPFARGEGLRAVNLSLLFLLSQLATIAGFFWEQRQQASATNHQLSDPGTD